MPVMSGGSSISRSGREENDRREGEDGCESRSLRSRSRSGRLLNRRDIDGELGGGSGSAYGVDKKEAVGDGSSSYGGENLDIGDGGFSGSTPIE